MKKLVSIALVAILVFGITVVTFAAPTVPGAVYSDQQAAGSNKPVQQIQQELQQAGIKDVQPSNWFAGSITVIVQAGLLKPDSDGNFHPEATLNTGDGVAVFAKVLGIAAKNDTPDVALQKAKSAGLVGSGTSADKDMSRLDVAKLLSAALGVKPTAITDPTKYPFADFDSISTEDRGILKALYDLGIFKGYEDKTFRPDAVLTRAEIAILVDRILGAK